MARHMLSRRAILVGTATMLASKPIKVVAQSAGPAIHVLKDPNCGCCSAWIEILKKNGFSVTVEPSAGTLLMRHKAENGVPQEMFSCHTGEVEEYLIEGHVPVQDILRLLKERPDAVGLAVPGMPYGSPGMGPETEREAYDVLLIARGGSTSVFTRYPAA